MKRSALLTSLTLSLFFNTVATYITIHLVNGTTVLEGNPVGVVELNNFGPGVLWLHPAIVLSYFFLVWWMTSSPSVPRRESSFHQKVHRSATYFVVVFMPVFNFVDMVNDLKVLILVKVFLANPHTTALMAQLVLFLR